MRRLLLTLTAALLCSVSAQAQSLEGLLKSLSNAIGGTPEKIEESAKKVALPKQNELAGIWTFEKLDIEYKGNDPLATLAISTAKQQLPDLTAKAGLEQGREKLHIKENNTLVFSIDGNDIPARYSYIEPTGTLIITIESNGHKAIFTSYIAIEDKQLRVMFDANELLAIADANAPQLNEDEMFAMAKAILSSYKGIYIGAIFK